MIVKPRVLRCLPDNRSVQRTLRLFHSEEPFDFTEDLCHWSCS